MTYQGIFHQSNTTTKGAGNDYSSETAPRFTPVVRVAQPLFCVVFFSVFVFLIIVYPFVLFLLTVVLCCLSFFDLRLLINSLVSSDFSKRWVVMIITVLLECDR